MEKEREQAREKVKEKVKMKREKMGSRWRRASWSWPLPPRTGRYSPSGTPTDSPRW
jgi:hypothetical protein